jgi:non-ribosomal peptide synthetase component F
MNDPVRDPETSRRKAIGLAAAFGATLARAHPVATTTLELDGTPLTLRVPEDADATTWLMAVSSFLPDAAPWQLRARCDGALFTVALTSGLDGQAHFDGPPALTARVADATRHVLSQLDAGAALNVLDLITDSEARTLDAWSGEDGDYPRSETIASVFARIAAVHADRPAVEAEQNLTYGALAARVGSLAGALTALGVAHGDTVAFFLERGAD